MLTTRQRNNNALYVYKERSRKKGNEFSLH